MNTRMMNRLANSIPDHHLHSFRKCTVSGLTSLLAIYNESHKYICISNAVKLICLPGFFQMQYKGAEESEQHTESVQL